MIKGAKVETLLTDSNHPRTEVKVDSDIYELVPGFCKSRKKDLENLNQHLMAKDFVSISKISHTIKGVARPYGFPTLESYAVKLEKSAKENKQLECQEILNLMANYFKTYCS